MNRIVKQVGVKTKLYGVLDTEDGIKETVDSTYLQFAYGTISDAEIGRLTIALIDEFGNCEVRKSILS